MPKPIRNAFLPGPPQTRPGPGRHVNIHSRHPYQEHQSAQICDAEQESSDSSPVSTQGQEFEPALYPQMHSNCSDSDIPRKGRRDGESVSRRSLSSTRRSLSSTRRSLSTTRSKAHPGRSSTDDVVHATRRPEVPPNTGYKTHRQQEGSTVDVMPLPKDRQRSDATSTRGRAANKAKESGWDRLRQFCREVNETGPRGDGDIAKDLFHAIQKKSRKGKKTQGKNEDGERGSSQRKEASKATFENSRQQHHNAPMNASGHQKGVLETRGGPLSPPSHNKNSGSDIDVSRPYRDLQRQPPTKSNTTQTYRDSQTPPFNSPHPVNSFRSTNPFQPSNGPPQNVNRSSSVYSMPISPLTKSTTSQGWSQKHQYRPNRSSSEYLDSPPSTGRPSPRQHPKQEERVRVSTDSHEIPVAASASVASDARETLVDLDKPLPPPPAIAPPPKRQQTKRAPPPKPLVVKHGQSPDILRGRQVARGPVEQVGRLPPPPPPKSALCPKTKKSVGFQLDVEKPKASPKPSVWNSFKVPHWTRTVTANKSFLKSQISAPRPISPSDERNFTISHPGTPATHADRLNSGAHRSPRLLNPSPLRRVKQPDSRASSEPPKSKRPELAVNTDVSPWKSSTSKFFSRFSRDTEEKGGGTRTRRRASSDASFVCQGVVYVGMDKGTCHPDEFRTRMGSSDSKRRGGYYGEPGAGVRTDTTLQTERPAPSSGEIETVDVPPPLTISKSRYPYEDYRSPAVETQPGSQQTADRDTQFYMFESGDSGKGVQCPTEEQHISVDKVQEQDEEHQTDANRVLAQGEDCQPDTDITHVSPPPPDPPDDGQLPVLTSDEEAVSIETGTESDERSTPPSIEEGFSEAFNRVFVKEEADFVESPDEIGEVGGSVREA